MTENNFGSEVPILTFNVNYSLVIEDTLIINLPHDFRSVPDSHAFSRQSSQLPYFFSLRWRLGSEVTVRWGSRGAVSSSLACTEGDGLFPFVPFGNISVPKALVVIWSSNLWFVLSELVVFRQSFLLIKYLWNCLSDGQLCSLPISSHRLFT